MAIAKVYAQSLATAYKEYRTKYEKAADRLHEIERDIEETRKNRDLTQKARDARSFLLQQKRSAAVQDLENIQSDAKQRFGAIRKDARLSFTQYRPNTESIDRDMLDLLDSGILSPSEIVEIINEKGYLQNNFTMSRMLGRKLDLMADKLPNQADRQKIQALAYQLEEVSSPVEKMIDSFTTTAIAALRSDTLLADGIAEAVVPDALAELDAAAAAIDGE